MVSLIYFETAKEKLFLCITLTMFIDLILFIYLSIKR